MPSACAARTLLAIGYSVVATSTQLQLLGGYLYFHKAPNAQEFFEETRDKVTIVTLSLQLSTFE